MYRHTIDNNGIQNSLLADDTTQQLLDLESVKRSIYPLKKGSMGLKINTEKNPQSIFTPLQTAIITHMVFHRNT